MITEHINTHSLQLKIREKEKELFALKREYADLYRPVIGKVVVDPPNQYYCGSCFNQRCLFHPIHGQNRHADNARNFSYMNGCLEWLPAGVKKDV